jgi:hypothetical protein
LLKSQLNEGLANPQSICSIADADLGFILPMGPEVPGFLLYTDATCLETYFCTKSALSKLLRCYCSIETTDAEHLISNLEKPLRQMMAIRVALTESGIPLGWIKTPNIEIDGPRVDFDWKDHLHRILSSTGNLSHFTEAIKNCGRHSAKIASLDLQEAIHGHDFIWLLRAYLRKLGVSQKLLDDDVFFRAFSLCSGAEDFEKCGLFKVISKFGNLQRAQSSPDDISTAPDPLQPPRLTHL